MEVAKQLVLQGYGITFTTMDNTKMKMIEQGLVLRQLKQPIVFQKGFLMKRGRQLSPDVNMLITFVKDMVEQLRKGLA